MVKDPGNIKKAVEAARGQSPAGRDINLSALKDAKAGSPFQVFTPEGEPSFWMVPFLQGNLACGFAFVELSGEVSRIGVFGSGPEDKASWIEASFFRRPPPAIMKEIRAKHPDSELSEPLFSFDRSRDRWAWMLKMTKRDHTRAHIFIAPGGWHERQPESRITDREY